MDTMRFVSRGLLAAALLNGVALAATPADGHHAHAPVAGALDHGHRWSTDPPLRDGMTAMRTAVDARLPAIHDGSLDAAGYATLAASLESSLKTIFANCRLAPQADAQLHGVLLPMHAALGRMADAPDVASRRAAALEFITGFGRYAAHFDHPGWQPLRDH